MLLTSGDVDISGVEETMQLVKSLGRVRVRGRIFNLHPKKYLILWECSEVVKPDQVPLKVFPIGGWETSDHHMRNCTDVSQDWNQNLSGQTAYRGSMENERPRYTGKDAINPTEAILRAVSDLLGKTAKSSIDSGSYQHLHCFSDLLRVPVGEEQFDHWMGQAWLVMEECDCSPQDQGRRLFESLQGPSTRCS